MHLLPYIFGISCFVIFYNYIGYAFIAYFLTILKKTKKPPEDIEPFFPTVSFIVAAFNEGDCIEKKIINSLQQNYPAGRIEFIFITDGSTDGTPAIIQNYSSIQLLHQQERKGKSAALNRAVAAAQNDILIFSDANTILNQGATRNITRHYKNYRVGGVAGEKKVIPLSNCSDEVGTSEEMYWKYESFLKKLDSDFYSVVGAAGELFSIRRNLYEPLSDTVILDDFVISLAVAQKGYRIVFEPNASAMELPSFSLEEEQKRKVRIAAGGFQSICILKDLLLFWKQPKLSFLYISHRVLRWTLSPLCLMTAFISNAVLYYTTDSLAYKTFFIVQMSFYLLAALAPFVPSGNRYYKILKFSYYFVFMNLSVIKGFFRFLRGKQSTKWEKSRRIQYMPTMEKL